MTRRRHKPHHNDSTACLALCVAFAAALAVGFGVMLLGHAGLI